MSLGVDKAQHTFFEKDLPRRTFSVHAFGAGAQRIRRIQRMMGSGALRIKVESLSTGGYGRESSMAEIVGGFRNWLQA